MFKLYNNSKSHINTEKITNTIYSLIPLNIFQTWYTLELPDKMRKNQEELKKDNPEFKYHLYDDEMCRDFIKQHFNEETLWAFDKLIPGAYKADLWRYCVLYIHGGIYLDIKFQCIKNFKLIQLTDKEYWVKDLHEHVVKSIYQAVMITYPRNEILWKAIQAILHNCKTNNYTGINSLAISGPSLLGQFFNELELKKISLNNIGHIVTKNKQQILKHYDEYRLEQSQKQKTQHYALMWDTLDIYKYPILQSHWNLDLTKKYSCSNNKNTYNSSIPLLIVNDDSIKLYIEYCNEYYSPEGYKQNKDINEKSKFSLTKYDFDFNKIDDEFFFNFYEKSDNNLILCSIDNDIYYKSDHFNSNHKKYYIASNKLIMNDDNNIDFNFIDEKTYRLHNKINNNPSSFLNIKDELIFIYHWYPLQIGNINYDKNEMKINKIKYDTPEFFKNIKKASCGVLKENEIWFLLNIENVNVQKKTIFNNKHLFSIFDLELNFKRHSELFSFTGEKNEFCRSFVFKDDDIILGYGVSNKECFIAKYNFKDICKTLRWFNV